jgi:hypothetical protein
MESRLAVFRELSEIAYERPGTILTENNFTKRQKERGDGRRQLFQKGFVPIVMQPAKKIP